MSSGKLIYLEHIDGSMVVIREVLCLNSMNTTVMNIQVLVKNTFNKVNPLTKREMASKLNVSLGTGNWVIRQNLCAKFSKKCKVHGSTLLSSPNDVNARGSRNLSVAIGRNLWGQMKPCSISVVVMDVVKYAMCVNNVMCQARHISCWAGVYFNGNPDKNHWQGH